MCRLQQGNTQAADILLQRYKGPLFSFLYRLTVNQSDSEDIFQETWLRVIRYAHTFQKQKKFSTWLFQIATNCTRDFFRRKKETVPLEENIELIAQNKQPTFENKQWATMLVKKLSLSQREVVILKFFHQKKEREIAEILNIPLGTVKSRLHKAVNYLREMGGNNE